MTDIGKLATEQRNAASERIDRLPTLDMVRLINIEDKKVCIRPLAPHRSPLPSGCR